MRRSIANWTVIHAVAMLISAIVSVYLGNLHALILVSLLSFSYCILRHGRLILSQNKGGGIANWITLVRLFLLLVLVDKFDLMPSAWFAVTGLGLILLDGLDGFLARRLNQQTEFGAVFDLEVDALFVAAFSVLICQQYPIGVWLLVAGLLRYAFVLLLAVLRWTNKPGVTMKESRPIALIFFFAVLSPFVLPISVAIWILALSSLLICFSFVKEFVLLSKR